MRTYLEMSRDEVHGGGDWSFGKCLWAPSKKKNGSNWSFWGRVKDVRKGDEIWHLRGVPPDAKFIGYSIAASDGFETSERPPKPGKWAFAQRFVRVNLTSFTPLEQPINLNSVFMERRMQLEKLLLQNKALPRRRQSKLFYVRQGGRLQCYNGGYFSDLDAPLLEALFGEEQTLERSPLSYVSVATGVQIAQVVRRIGHEKFSEQVKDMYCNRCCYPGCTITSGRFLVGAHIARWSDNVELRGNPGNGICLCVFHDKAFEVGLFTIDSDLSIHLNPKFDRSPEANILVPGLQKKILRAEIPPLPEALAEHWKRINWKPC